MAPPGTLRLSNHFIIRDSGVQESLPWGAGQAEVDDLPDEVLSVSAGQPLLRHRPAGDRSLEAVRPGIPGGHSRRCRQSWIIPHARIKFGYEHARPDRTASEGHAERKGVCRDFAHLAITLCRCMNVPARYCTGYLGDIGVPADPAPMDFSAWFEVYLGGAWHTLDARHNMPRIGRILMARGRDATDAAISTAFGTAKLVRFDVVTQEVTTSSA